MPSSMCVLPPFPLTNINTRSTYIFNSAVVFFSEKAQQEIFYVYRYKRIKRTLKQIYYALIEYLKFSCRYHRLKLNIFQ